MKPTLKTPLLSVAIEVPVPLTTTEMPPVVAPRVPTTMGRPGPTPVMFRFSIPPCKVRVEALSPRPVGVFRLI